MQLVPVVPLNRYGSVMKPSALLTKQLLRELGSTLEYDTAFGTRF